MGIRYEPAIDGLRAVAVLSVIAYHVGAPAGYVGVDVFFVISGYLITKILLGDPSLLTFYARRARRILPAAFLVVLVTLALSFVLLPSAGDVARSAAAAGVFVANVYFQSATGGYWDASADTMPLLHLWSLSVEEQFYLFWPLLLALGAAQGSLHHFDVRIHRLLSGFLRHFRGGRELDQDVPIQNLGADLAGRNADLFAEGGDEVGQLDFVGHGRTVRLVWILFFASLTLYACLSWASPEAAFYQTPARAWELAAGGLVALVNRDSAAAVRAGVEVLGRPCVHDDIVVPLATRDDFAAVPRVSDGRRGLLAIIRLALHPFRQQLHALSRARLQVPSILRNIASLVLQHASHIGLPLVLLACLVPMPVWAAQPIAVLGATMLVAAVHAGKPVPILASRPLVYVGLISYSLYLWHWPLLAIDRATRIGPAPLETRLFLVVTAFVLAVLTYRYVETPFRRMQAKPRRAVAIGVVCAAALSCTAFVMADTPKPATPQTMLTSTRLCHPGTYKLQAPECVPEARKLVLWSDSYGRAWERHAERLAKQEGMPAVSMLETGCPIALTDVPRPTRRASQFCKERAERDFAYLQKGADTLLVTAHWSRLLRERPGSQSTVLAWAKGLPNVRRIIIVGASPELRDSVEKCQALKVSCDIPREDYEKSAAETKALMAELAKLPNVEVWNIGDWLCDAKVCPGIRDGMPLYYNDGDHVSIQAVEAYVREFPTPKSSR